jgi:hypothetical protein
LLRKGNLSLLEKKRSYVAYECAPSTETRGSLETENHCYTWSHRSTKYNKEELEARRGNLQCACKNPACSIRPRKSVAGLWFFDTETEAVEFAARMNSMSANIVFSNPSEVEE